jgi:hypothetical protein
MRHQGWVVAGYQFGIDARARIVENGADCAHRKGIRIDRRAGEQTGGRQSVSRARSDRQQWQQSRQN